MPYARHVYHVYAVRSPNRDALARGLQERGVSTGIHYPTPVHLQPAYSDLGYGPGSFPVAEALSREVLSLPMFPELSPEQIDEVAAAVRALS
jgi:dTDP-4-amino-4,6-dideoxygalactose transaminase